MLHICDTSHFKNIRQSEEKYMSVKLSRHLYVFFIIIIYYSKIPKDPNIGTLLKSRF